MALLTHLPHNHNQCTLGLMKENKMPVPVIVLNFGHSVLRSLDDYTEAASEIYRHYRQGQNVIAVTSAQGDQTDILLAEARQIGPGEDAKNLPELIQLGERRSAALLALALERIGTLIFCSEWLSVSLLKWIRNV